MQLDPHILSQLARLPGLAGAKLAAPAQNEEPGEKYMKRAEKLFLNPPKTKAGTAVIETMPKDAAGIYFDTKNRTYELDTLLKDATGTHIRLESDLPHKEKREYGNIQSRIAFEIQHNHEVSDEMLEANERLGTLVGITTISIKDAQHIRDRVNQFAKAAGIDEPINIQILTHTLSSKYQNDKADLNADASEDIDAEGKRHLTLRIDNDILAALSPKHLDAILAHEIAHLKQKHQRTTEHYTEKQRHASDDQKTSSGETALRYARFSEYDADMVAVGLLGSTKQLYEALAICSQYQNDKLSIYTSLSTTNEHRVAESLKDEKSDHPSMIRRIAALMEFEDTSRGMVWEKDTMHTAPLPKTSKSQHR